MLRTSVFRLTVLLLALYSGLVALALPVVAQSNSSSVISRGYTATGNNLVAGALVSTKQSDASAVEIASTTSKNRLAGVVDSDAVVKLSNGDKNTEVQIALQGSTLAIVSDINGSIRPGDKITISPIAGVGMLATSDGQIVGVARTALDKDDTRQQTVTDRSGKSHTVRIGSVLLDVGVAHYAVPTNKFLPPFLQSMANGIAGRPVSFARILLALVVLLLAFIGIFGMVYGSSKAGVISLGRNPLAARAIQRGLLSIGLITLLIVALTIALTYLILIY